MKIIATNKKAYHDYFVEETYEAGIVLVGTEVKSVRLGKVNLRDSYAVIKTARFFSRARTFRLTKRGAISTSTLCARESCCSTRRRYAV